PSSAGSVDHYPRHKDITTGYQNSPVRSPGAITFGVSNSQVKAHPGSLPDRHSVLNGCVSRMRTCGPQKPLPVAICMTHGADSGFFLRLAKELCSGFFALGEADLPYCRFEAFGLLLDEGEVFFDGVLPLLQFIIGQQILI